MVTLICRCGHEIWRHKCDARNPQRPHHSGACNVASCTCEAFDLDRDKTRFDTAEHRRNAMNERKDLQ